MSDIFSRFSTGYFQKHEMNHQQKKAFNAIINCRTNALGGHVLKCDNCGNIKHAYNSCRNRHCPKCQYLRQAMWTDKLKARLLPVRYYHVVFTVPATLHKLFYANQSICYELLLKSASGAILKAGENPRFLGGKTGCVAVLHTWGQALTYHPHVHLLVPAGGFDTDLMEWIKTDKNFFAPVKVLSTIFRGIFAQNIYKYAGKLIPQTVDRETEIALLRKLVYKSNWNVFVKPAFNNAEKVIEYLGRYTHRVAISNARILAMTNARVRFIWKDYRNNGRRGIMELDGIDFISRFMMHILPDGFYKVRYYGIFAARFCRNTIDTWLSLNDRQMYIPSMEGKPWHEIVQEMFGYDPFRCSICKKGKMLQYNMLYAEPRAA